MVELKVNQHFTLALLSIFTAQ